MALDPLAVVRAAMEGEPGASGQPNRRITASEHSTTTLSPGLRKLAVLYVVYLFFTAFRIQEVITVLAIPKLPMLISVALAAGLVFGAPPGIWTFFFSRSVIFRWQVVITGLAVITAPLGIWVGNSLDYLYPGYFIGVMVFVGAIVLLRDREVRIFTLQALTVALSFITALVLLGVGAGSVGDEGRLKVGESLDPNDFAWILATFVPVALWLGVRKRSTAIFWFGAAALLALGVVPTQSRGGFLALISAALALVLVGTSGWRRILMLAALGALGSIVLMYIDATGASRLIDFSSYEGGTGRTDLWRQGVTWMFQRPWGYGMGNYATFNSWMTNSDLAAHSAYVMIGMELGVLALIGYLAMWYTGLVRLNSFRRAALSEHTDDSCRNDGVMVGYLLAALIANAVGSAFLNTQYASLTLLMLGLAGAVILGLPSRPRLTRQETNVAITRPWGRSGAMSVARRPNSSAPRHPGRRA